MAALPNRRRDDSDAGPPSLFALDAADPTPKGDELRILSALESGVLPPSRRRKARRTPWLVGAASATAVAAAAAAAWFAWPRDTTPEPTLAQADAPLDRPAASAAPIAAAASASTSAERGAVIETIATPEVTVASAEPAASPSVVTDTAAAASAPAASPLALLEPAQASAPAAAASVATTVPPATVASASAARPAAADHKQRHTAHNAATREAHHTAKPHKAAKPDDADVDLLEAMVAHMRKPVPEPKKSAPTSSKP